MPVHRLAKIKFGASRRRRGTTSPPEWEDHIKHVGEVTFAWTQLQSALFTVFFLLLKDQKLANGLWHCLRSDAAQHQMLVAAAEAKLHGRKRILNQIVWVVDCAGRLSAARNVLTHTALLLFPDFENEQYVSVPDFLGGRAASAKRLDEATPRQWERVAGDLRALEGYTRMIGMRIMSKPTAGKRIQWPPRPKLRSIEAKKQGGRSKKRPAKK